MRDPLIVLAQLGAAALIAIGAIMLLLRYSGAGQRAGIVRGFPPSLFPNQDLVRAGPLAALAAIQARLLAVYEQTPQQSDLAIWLGQFLPELRAIMDTAYRAAAIGSVYGQHEPLERLVADVQAIEAQISALAIDLILAGRDQPAAVGLAERLATLRLCARELASVADPLAAFQALP